MIYELIKEEYLDLYLDYLNKDKKSFKRTRAVYGIILFLIYALGVLILGKYILFLGLPIAYLIGYKIPYWDLLMSKKQSDLIVSFLFPQFLQNFMALISTSGNVYQTLKATIDYTSEPLKSKLIELVEKIGYENKREHYIEFANHIGTGEAHMIMDIIYQFSEFGVRKETINDLRNYIQNLQENKINELIEKKLLSAEKYGYTPIFIAFFIVIGYAGVIFMYYMQDVLDVLNVVF